MTTKTQLPQIEKGSKSYQAPEIHQITMDAEGIFCLSGEQNDPFGPGEDFFLF